MGYLSHLLYSRPHGNEWISKMEHNHNSRCDESDVSKQPGFTLNVHGLNVCISEVVCKCVAPLSFSLFFLTVLNLGLFFKLSAMEEVAHRMYLSTKHRLKERSESRSVHILLCDKFKRKLSSCCQGGG